MTTEDLDEFADGFTTTFGEETDTESVGWYSISALGLIVAFIVFFMLVRVKEENP